MVKTAVKKKSKTNTAVKEAVRLFEERSEIRGRIGSAAYNAQDKKTKAVIDSMMDQLMLGASGTISVPDGGTAIPVKVGIEFVELNALYAATEILKDLAMMDVKVANYTFPDVYCAECGDKIMKPKKKKGRK